MKKFLTTTLAATFLFSTAAFANKDHDKEMGSKKPFIETLKKDLGDDWSVKESGKKITAMKKDTEKTDNLDREKLDTEIADVRNDHKNVKAAYDNGTVTISGMCDDCGDLSSDIKDVAKVSGVKKIEVDVTCSEKA